MNKSNEKEAEERAKAEMVSRADKYLTPDVFVNGESWAVSFADFTASEVALALKEKEAEIAELREALKKIQNDTHEIYTARMAFAALKENK